MQYYTRVEATECSRVRSDSIGTRMAAEYNTQHVIVATRDLPHWELAQATAVLLQSQAQSTFAASVALGTARQIQRVQA